MRDWRFCHRLNKNEQYDMRAIEISSAWRFRLMSSIVRLCMHLLALRMRTLEKCSARSTTRF